MKPNPRPFTLGELMVMIAVLAFGFSLARWVQAPLDPALTKHLGNWGSTYGRPQTWVDVPWRGHPSCYAFVLAAALVPMRGRRPRPSRARLLRQPGAVACLSIIISAC